jgi:hypothetical protein
MRCFKNVHFVEHCKMLVDAELVGVQILPPFLKPTQYGPIGSIDLREITRRLLSFTEFIPDEASFIPQHPHIILDLRRLTLKSL